LLELIISEHKAHLFILRTVQLILVQSGLM